ncbi:MAG: hypothetical protein ABSC05_12415, partial [Candidatus Solibacter sp.]
MGGGNIWHDSTVNVQVFSTGTFTLTASPITQSVSSPGVNATFAINVASVNGFTGQVAFSTSVLPACVAPTFPLMTAPGAGNLVLGTSSCAPGTYAVSIVGVSGAANTSVPVTLVVQGPPAPANIISPGTGSTLSDPSPLFTWDSGSQVTGYQLNVATTDGPACSAQYTGGSQSAVMGLAPCCTSQRGLLATLTSTFASGPSQSRSYNYTCGPVTGPGDFTFKLPASLTVDAGFQSSLLATIIPAGQLGSSVSWSFTPNNPGITAVWAVNSQPSLSATTATATLTAAASLPPGAYQLTVTAATHGASAITHSANVSISVQKPFRAQSETNIGPISFLEYDTRPGLGNYPLLISLCGAGSSMRACYQQVILRKYANQLGVTPAPAQSDISGVRFMFDLTDALTYSGDSAALNQTWVTNVEAFFQDLYNAGIYKITPNIREWTAVPPNQRQGIPVSQSDTAFTSLTSCPQMYANYRLVRFTPTAPYAEVCSDGGTLCTINDLTNYGNWDLDRAPYECAVQNPHFVGWSRIYDVVDAMLQAARDNALTVEEFDAQNEILLSTYPARARLIVDNTNNNEDVLGNVATGLRSLRHSMQSQGFDPGRVTYSVTDDNPSTPNGECPLLNPPYFGDSARLLGLSMLSATLAAGGPFGSFNWQWDLPGAGDTQVPASSYTWTGFACGAALGLDGRPLGASFLQGITHSSPTIVDVHSGPCVVIPKIVANLPPGTPDPNNTNGWGQCNWNAQAELGVATWANVQGEATKMGNALAAFLNSRQQTDANLANALVMLGETHGRLNNGCLLDPNAVNGYDLFHVTWDPSTGASTAEGFGSSNLINATRLNGLQASLVYRPWEYLQQGPDDPSKPAPPTPQPGACNTIVTNPPYTPVR